MILPCRTQPVDPPPAATNLTPRDYTVYKTPGEEQTTPENRLLAVAVEVINVLADVMDTSSRPSEIILAISSLILNLFEFYKHHCVGMTTGFPMLEQKHSFRPPQKIDIPCFSDKDTLHIALE